MDWSYHATTSSLDTANIFRQRDERTESMSLMNVRVKLNTRFWVNQKMSNFVVMSRGESRGREVITLGIFDK